ncbi:MAG: hypothetical protein ACTSX1_04485 [Candidatus Heimdallarchaeaceae archaeon]
MSLNIGDYVWTEKGRRSVGPTGGRIVGFTTWRDYGAVKVKKANGNIRTFLEQNLNTISRRTFGRRTGVNSIPLR